MTSPLSETQAEIVLRLASGKPVKVIAHEMGRTLDETYYGLRSAQATASARNAYELIAKAIREGWIK